MCGIAGLVGSFLPGLVERMNAAQIHRGPDGNGVFDDAEAEVALGHVRLSILDLSTAASQPMLSPDGRYVLVFNGEIYNFKDLREGLEAKGHSFTSTGDTEVLLQGLIEYGEDFIDKLNGMFAFAVWDRRRGELLAARDHFGIKPFYYAAPEPGTVLFASEIKALCAHPGLSREPDFQALQQHLAYCHASGDSTALKAVKRLPAGHLLRWKAGTRRIEIRRFWSPRFDETPPCERAEEVERLREQVHEATARQLVSDVPTGSLLSGGLDSSFITAAAVQRAAHGFGCYTITYPPSENQLDRFDDDAPHARTMARELGLPLEEISPQPTVTELWPRLIRHLDEPIADPAAITSYLICKRARENGTIVLLSGQGADELFCGYPRYLAMHKTAWLAKAPYFPRRVAAVAARALPGSREGRLGALSRRVRRVLVEIDRPAEQRFLAYCANTPQAEIHRVLSTEFRAALNGQQFTAECEQHMKSRGLAGLHRLQDRDLSIYLPNHNLLYTDKMGMAVGVEARVPLLDVKLAGRVARYPCDWLLAKGQTKVLLRQAAEGVVPRDIIYRRKAGFGAPYRKWLRYDLAEMWNDLTSEDVVRRRGWFDHAALQDARARSQAGKNDLYMLQWAVLTMELWARQFVDDDPLTAPCTATPHLRRVSVATP